MPPDGLELGAWIEYCVSDYEESGVWAQGEVCVGYQRTLAGVWLVCSGYRSTWLTRLCRHVACCEAQGSKLTCGMAPPLGRMAW